MTKIDQDYKLYNQTAESYDHIRFSGFSGQWGHKIQIQQLQHTLLWEF